MWFVYVIYSKSYDRVYIGMSESPEKRLLGHNSGETKSTKGFRPWVLIYKESIGSRENARKREKYLKSGIGREFIKNLKK